MDEAFRTIARERERELTEARARIKELETWAETWRPYLEQLAEPGVMASIATVTKDLKKATRELEKCAETIEALRTERDELKRELRETRAERDAAVRAARPKPKGRAK